MGFVGLVWMCWSGERREGRERRRERRRERGRKGREGRARCRAGFAYDDLDNFVQRLGRALVFFHRLLFGRDEGDFVQLLHGHGWVGSFLRV